MRNIKGPLLVRVSLVNATRKRLLGKWPPGEEFGPYEDLRSLYKDMKSEWGGRVSAMYLDSADGGTRQVGWVFTRRVAYEGDPRKTYVREAWVEVVREVSPAAEAAYESVGWAPAGCAREEASPVAEQFDRQVEFKIVVFSPGNGKFVADAYVNGERRRRGCGHDTRREAFTEAAGWMISSFAKESDHAPGNDPG